jgi:hypothetical protein
MASIEMPNGVRYRIGSTRRYIVVSWRKGISKWMAEYRTDVESRALASWRHEARICEAAHLIDTKAEGGPAVIR